MKPRFLLDEHIDHVIQRQLRRLDSQVDVLVIGDPDAPPIGTPDPDILLWIEATGYILVTENRSTIPMHLSDHYADGRHIPGVLWIRPATPIGRVIEELYMIWYTSTADEYVDRALFIPL